MTKQRVVSWDGVGPFPVIDKIEPGESVRIDCPPGVMEMLKAAGARLTWRNPDGSTGSAPIEFGPPPRRLWPPPHWAVLFAFMCNIGVMFWALSARPATLLSGAAAVFSLALAIALPNLPTLWRSR